MIIYSASLEDFYHDSIYNEIADNIEKGFDRAGISHNNIREYHSFQNSYRALALLLMTSKTIDKSAKVAIEFRIPGINGPRIDFLITGKDEHGAKNAVIIELKQWEEVKPTDGFELVTYVGNGNRAEPHPSYQAKSYATAIWDFNKDARDKAIGLYPCSYLFNFARYNDEHQLSFMLDEKYSLLLNESPCFVKNQAKELLAYIESHIRYSDDGESLSVLEHGKLEPSPILVSSINKIIHEDASFALVDTQKVAFEKIKALVEACKIDGRKHAILVNGGPGTGKTLIAAHLLGHFLQKGYSCVYSTKNRDLRSILGDELGGNPSLGNIIKYPRTLLDMDEDSLDLALVDESQRLSLYDERRHKFGPVQVEQIIKSSKVSVFFIDDKQIVTSSDATTKSLIYESSKNAGAIFHDGESFTLTTQFRCIGADNYMPFIEYFIYGDKNGLSLISDESDSTFDFKVFDDLSAMSEALRKKRKEGNSARMVAGFCYKWKSKKDDSVFDIEIGDFKAKWNKLRKNAADGVPWALDDAQAERVGCIHTCQGLEFNYVGVIIGKDMFFKDGKVQTDFRQHPSDDNAFKGLKRVNNNEELADRLIRNTYRVLLTRGQKGCYVYCEDKALAKYINNSSKKFKIKSY